MGVICCRRDVEDLDVSISGIGVSTQDKLTAHKAKAFLVTCMDFRLLNDARNIMKKKGLDVNYDQFILAGVSLGYNQTKYGYWKKVMLDHINMSIKLHHTSKVILLDHLDCGAYKTFVEGLTPENEVEEHKKNLLAAKNDIKAQIPSVEVYTWILHMDGSFDTPKL